MKKQRTATRRAGTRRAARKSPAPAPVAKGPADTPAADSPTTPASVPDVITIPLGLLPAGAARAIGGTLNAAADARREALGQPDRGAWELIFAAAWCTAHAHRGNAEVAAIAGEIAAQAEAEGRKVGFAPGVHTPCAGVVVRSV